MSARRAFYLLAAVSVLAATLLSLALLGPLVVASFLHNQHMPGFLHDVVLVCFLQPTLADWVLLLSISLPTLLLLVIVVACAVSLLGQWYRTRKLVASLLIARSSVEDSSLSVVPVVLARHGLWGRVDFVDVDAPIAFCHGWVRTRICLSRGAVAGLDEGEVAAVLLHERYHMRNHDPLKTALSRTFARVFFFLPVVRALREHYLLAREFEADIYVLTHQSTSISLLGALCKLVLRQVKKPLPGALSDLSASPFPAIVGYTGSVNERIEHLLSGHLPEPMPIPRSVRTRTALVIAAIIFAALLATWDAAANTMWHHAYCTLSTCPIMH